MRLDFDCARYRREAHGDRTGLGRVQRGRTRGAPARDDTGIGQIPAISKAGRDDAETRTDGGDEARPGRCATAVMRHEHDIRSKRLRQQFCLGICFGIGQQQCAAPDSGDVQRTGVVVVAAGFSGHRMQHPEFDSIPMPAIAAAAGCRVSPGLYAGTHDEFGDRNRIAQEPGTTGVIAVVVTE